MGLPEWPYDLNRGPTKNVPKRVKRNHYLMNWTTKTQYVDIETGELIHKQKVLNGMYIILGQEIKYTKQSNDYGTRHITYKCERNRQSKLF